MKKKLKILILEDVSTDAELVEHELYKEKIEFSSKRVETKKDFLRELKYFTPDIIISDYRLPQFNGMEALELVKKLAPSIPFIICTGSMNEETAVECMKAGASDYIIKEHLVRISPAIKSALESKRIREEKERAEKALQLSSREWQTTFNAINDSLCLIDLEGKILRCNNVMTKLVKLTIKDILGQKCCRLIHNRLKPMEVCPFVRMLKSSQRETHIFQKGNQWYICSVDPIFDKAGNLVNAVFILSDITKIKEAEERLNKERNLLRTLIDNIPDLIYIKDPESRFSLVNNAVANIMGAKIPDELIGKTDFDYYPHELASHYHNDEQDIIEKGNPIFNKEEINIDSDGKERWLSTTKVPLKDNYGNVIGIVGIGRDITEHKLADEKIENLARFPSENPSPVLRVRKDGLILYANDASLPLLKYWGCEVGQSITNPLQQIILNPFKSNQKKVIELEFKDKIFSFVIAPFIEAGYVNLYGSDITERKEAEKALKESEERFRLTIEATSDGLWENSTDHKKDFFSDRFFTMLGYEPMEPDKGFDFFKSLVHPDDAETLWKEYNALNEPGLDNYSVEFRLKAKDGTWQHILSRGKCVKRDEKGKPMRIVGTHTDITDRKLAEEALRASEERFALATQGTNDGIWDWDIKNNSLYWSPRMKGLIGYVDDELEVDFDMFTSNLHPDDIEPIQIAIEAHLKDRVPYNVEHRLRTKSGEYRWFHTRGEAVWDEAGNPFRMVGSSTDITNRKQAEQVLAESKQRLSLHIEQTPLGVIEWNLDFKVTEWNKAAERIFGFSREEALGDHAVELIVPESAKKIVDKVWSDLLAQKGGMRSTNENITKSGDTIICEWYNTPLVDENDNVIGVASLVQDITERLQAEEELRKLSVAVEQSPVVTVITDTKGNIEYVNPEFTELTGYSYKEVIGKNPRILKSGEHSPEFYKELWDTITSGKVWHGEFHNKKKNGDLYWDYASISPIKNEKGKITHFLGVMENITERKSLEGQLQHAQKMEAIGRFAGGIAHDFNNMMTAVIGFSDYLISQFKEGDSTRSIIEQIKNAGNRAASLTHQLLAFSRKQVMETQLIDINTIITDMEQMLKRLLGEDIDLQKSLNTKFALVKADQSQIEQIIMNLVVNARDAMPDGGKLIIETSKTELDEDYCQKWIDIQPSKYIVLTISDNGCGMDKDTQAHIFEPFFTTKEFGKGTGLGLSTVYGIVKQNNGYIHVYSEPDKGTTLKIYFPSTIEDKVDIGINQEASQESLKGSQTVLVVEDEELVRQITSTTLKDNGYTVLEASNSKEALPICENYPGKIHLLITDVVMPGMQGPSLAKKILSIHPEIGVLFMSGYTDKAAEQLELLDHESHFLEKPFTPKKLLSKIKEILQQDLIYKEQDR